MFLLAKYGVSTDIRFAMVKRGVLDLAATADWTPATGDTKVSKDGGNFANSTNNPAAVGGTGSVGWKLTLTATELQCAELNVQIVDSATKAVEDQFLTVYTYGHASAKIQADLSDVVRLGLTALPNAVAGAAGGLITRATGTPRIATAQAGAAGTITLDTSASAVDDFYNGMWVVVVNGTGAGQARPITDYVGSTKVATISPNWGVNPDSTSIFAIFGVA